MEKRYQCIISQTEEGKTVKQILTGKWKLGTGQIKKAKFREEGILVNGSQVTVRYVLKKGDRLEVLIEDKVYASAHLIPVESELNILYENADYLVVEKPAGLVCHPSGGHYCDSMANYLVAYYASRGQGFVVRLAGRLDKNTSGMLLYAKNAPALTCFEKQRKAGLMKKTYYGIVEGIPEEAKGRIEECIGPDPQVDMKQRVCGPEEGGLHAVTNYQVIGTGYIENQAYSLLMIHIETGRTHQIRCHMSWLGYPLAGDEMYGGHTDHIKRHALHAGRLQLEDPDSGKLCLYELDMPEDMRILVEDMVSIR